MLISQNWTPWGYLLNTMIYKYGIHTVPWYNDINAWIIPLQMQCLRKYDRGHKDICRGWMSFIFQPLEMSKRAHHPRHCALPGHQVGVQTGTSLTPAFQHIITTGALRQREAHTFLYNLCIKLITLEGGQACGIFTTIKQILSPKRFNATRFPWWAIIYSHSKRHDVAQQQPIRTYLIFKAKIHTGPGCSFKDTEEPEQEQQLMTATTIDARINECLCEGIKR